MKIMKFPFKINTKKNDCSKLLLSTFSFIANSSSDNDKPQEVSLEIDGKPKTFTVRVIK